MPDKIIIKTKGGDRYSTYSDKIKENQSIYDMFNGECITFIDGQNGDLIILPVENIDHMIVQNIKDK